MSTRLPSGGADLLAKQLQKRLQLRSGKAPARVTQAMGYVGVRASEPPFASYPVGAAWLELYREGRRDAGTMALEACRAAGRKITSPDKANRAVREELEALGFPNHWKIAKVKSGRPSKARAR